MKVKLFIISLLFVLFGCGDKQADTIEQLVFNPTSFNVELMRCDYFDAEIKWSESTIEDNSELMYDVYLNGEVQVEDFDGLTYSFEGLEEGTEYNVKVVVRSKYETYKETEFSFTTKTTPFPNAIVLKSESVSPEEIVVSWTDSEVDGSLKYDIFLNGELKASDVEVNTYTFSELNVLTKYTIKLFAKNMYGKSSEKSIEVTTIDYPAPDTFVLSVDDVTFNNANISWTTGEGEVCTYKILLNHEVKAESVEGLSYTFNDLKEGTNYLVTVIATNEYGKAVEQTIEFNTKVDDTPADFTISFSDISRTSVRVNWMTIGESDGSVLYDVFVDGFLRGQKIAGNTFVVDDLDAGTEYVVKVVVTNYANKTLAHEKVFTTKEKAVLSDFVVTANNITQTSVLLKWTECVASDGQGIVYTVFHPNGARVKAGGNYLECGVDALEANSSYVYKVEARSDDNSMLMVKTVTFETLAYDKPSDFEILISDIAQNSAKVTWTDSTLPTGGDVAYVLKVDGQSRVFENNEYIIENLQPSTSHVVEVVARSPHGIVTTKTKSFKTLPPKVYSMHVDATEINPRSFRIEWNYEDNPDIKYYDVFFEGQFKDRYNSAASLLFDNLVSKTDYVVKVIAVGRFEDKYEKEIVVRTSAYPEVLDFNIEIENQENYRSQSVNVFDFNDKNTGIISDIENVTSEFYLDGEFKGVVKSSDFTFVDLKPLTTYACRVVLKYPDGSFAFEKSVDFTTCDNVLPVWNGDLNIEKVGFGYVEFSNISASDLESDVTYAYYVNGEKRSGYVTIKNTIVISGIDSDVESEAYIVAEDKVGGKTKTNTVVFKTSLAAPLSFEAQVEKVGDVYRVKWDKMGDIGSVKGINCKIIINGVDVRSVYIGDYSDVKMEGDKFYFEYDFNPLFTIFNTEVFNFIVSIEWVSNEPQGYSTSRPLLLEK